MIQTNAKMLTSIHKNLIVMLIMLMFIMNNTSYSQEIKVMTFNIKYDNKTDTVNNWEFRKEGLINLVKHYQPNVMGIQEGLINQVNYIDSCLPNYSYIGVGREDGKSKGEFSTIFYDTTLVSVVKNSTFWLSEKPDTISIGWDAALERICTYGLFKFNNSEQKLWVFNTHFDHRGELARVKSASLILNKIKSLNSQNYPVVLMGDFNALPSEEPIRIISMHLNYAGEVSSSPLYGPNGTFNGFSDKIINNRIDYIFIKNLDVETYIHIDDRLNNNNHISDHFPVMSNLIFR